MDGYTCFIIIYAYNAFFGIKFTFDIQQTSLFIVAWATLDYEVFFSVLDTIDCAI